MNARRSFAAAIPGAYRPLHHLFWSALFGVGGPAAALSTLSHVRPLEPLMLPAGLVATNLVEYLGHRYLLHRRTRLAGFAYEAHALRHHACFPRAHMEIEAPRELWLVLFGLREVLIAVLAGAPFVLAARLISPNAAAFVAASLPLHYLLYETLHLASHLPGSHWLSRRRLFAAFRERHALHHGGAPVNYNVSLPLFDWLFGTLRR